MPAPIGQKPRDRKFLLRMTAGEDEYVRHLAVARHTSLNDAITGLIRDRMAAEQPPPPAPQPPRNAPRTSAPEPPKKRRPLHDRRKGSAKLTWSDVSPPEPIPGQTAITDDDQ